MPALCSLAANAAPAQAAARGNALAALVELADLQLQCARAAAAGGALSSSVGALNALAAAGRGPPGLPEEEAVALNAVSYIAAAARDPQSARSSCFSITG